jgi:hypothetical protein
MPAKDLYHDRVRMALIKDGWTITHDPLRLKWGTKDMYVDLGAERLLAAEKTGQKIAVEVKSFSGLSDMADLEKAVGQYAIYHAVMAQTEPERELYLAVDQEAYADIFDEPLGHLLIETYRLQQYLRQTSMVE